MEDASSLPTACAEAAEAACGATAAVTFGAACVEPGMDCEPVLEDSIWAAIQSAVQAATPWDFSWCLGMEAGAAALPQPWEAASCTPPSSGSSGDSSTSTVTPTPTPTGRRRVGRSSRHLSNTNLKSDCKLFVRLPRPTKAEELWAYFAHYGQVVDAIAMPPTGNQRFPSSFGFVTFASPSSAALALEDEHLLNGLPMEVRTAVPKELSATVQRPCGKIFVGGLPSAVGSEELRDYFCKFGRVKDAVVMVDPCTQRSRCFGFIYFGCDNAGVAAADVVLGQSHWLQGKWVDVKRAVPANELRAGGTPVQPPSRRPPAKQHGRPSWLRR